MEKESTQALDWVKEKFGDAASGVGDYIDIIANNADDVKHDPNIFTNKQFRKNVGDVFSDYLLPGGLATLGAGGLGALLTSRTPKRRGETASERRNRILKNALVTSGLTGVGLAGAGLTGAYLGTDFEKPNIPNKLDSILGELNEDLGITNRLGGGILGTASAAGANKFLKGRMHDVMSLGDSIKPGLTKNELAKALKNFDPAERIKMINKLNKRFMGMHPTALLMAAATGGDVVGNRLQSIFFNKPLTGDNAYLTTPSIAAGVGVNEGLKHVPKLKNPKVRATLGVLSALGMDNLIN